MQELLNLAQQVTHRAAVACFDLIGRGQSDAADAAAVEAMREALNSAPIDGRVVIGEGERDKAPMLYIGEEVGQGGTAVDIALDPLEGTALCAEDRPGSLAVLALSARGGLLMAPDVYMDKLAAPAGFEGVVDLKNSVQDNVIALAKAMDKPASELSVCVLKRGRHKGIIDAVRDTGARLKLIDDGDVAITLQVAFGEGIDLYLGQGGAPEGVLSAAALKCLGGIFQGRLMFRDEEEVSRARKWGIDDLDYQYDLNELAIGDIVFSATGVTSGDLLEGVSRDPYGFYSETLLLESQRGRRQKVEDFIAHRG